MNEICLIINVFHTRIKKLGYPAESMEWIRPYHLAMSEWDKSFIANTFVVPGNENTECTIFITINTYNMSMDNPDIKLVIQ